MRMFWVSFPGVIGNLFRLLFFLLSRWLLVLVDILVVLVAAVVSMVFWSRQHGLDGREGNYQFVDEVQDTADERWLVHVDDLQ